MFRLSIPIFLILGMQVSFGHAQRNPENVASFEGSGKDHPRFDVISLHESAPADSYSERLVDDDRSGLFLVENFRVSQLISDAFGLSFQFQVSDLPKNMQYRRFDITAKSDEATDRRLHSEANDIAIREKQQMLLSLLVDRFHLRYRIETRPLLSYDLQIGPKGIKIRELSRKDGEESGFRTERTEQGIDIQGKGVRLDDLPMILTFYLKSTVANKTGLRGTYDLALKFNNTTPSAETVSESQWPPLEIAVQQQLGLKLVPTKTPTPVVVIEHIEMPTPN